MSPTGTIIGGQDKVALQFDDFELDAIPRLLTKLGFKKPPNLRDGRVTVIWTYPPGFDNEGNRLSPNSVSIDPPSQYVRSWLEVKRHAIRALMERRVTVPEVAGIGGFEFFPQDRNLVRRIVGEVNSTVTTSLTEDRDPFEQEEMDRPGRHDRPVSEILEQLAAYANNRAVQLPEELDREKQIQKVFAKICFPKTYAGFLHREGIGAPVLQDGNHRYPLSHAASGEQVILEYITRLTYRGSIQRSIVLVDEPEVHLHPKWIRQLYLALPQIGQDNQFIMTTHSDELRKRAAAANFLIELGSLEGEK